MQGTRMIQNLYIIDEKDDDRCRDTQKTGFKEQRCVQHSLTSKRPITILYIYQDETLCTALKCIKPMPLLECKTCGRNFISVVEGCKSMEKSNKFELIFAAYYNTSQLIGNSNGR